MKEFFLDKKTYKNYGEFLWLKFKPAYRPNFKLKLFNKFKNNFNIFLSKFKHFLLYKFDGFFFVEEILFLTLQNKDEILQLIKNNIETFFCYGSYICDYYSEEYFQINCLQKRLSI